MSAAQGCKLKLTPSDDRDGTTFECPKCIPYGKAVRFFVLNEWGHTSPSEPEYRRSFLFPQHPRTHSSVTYPAQVATPNQGSHAGISGTEFH
jgi:hypothetical protein